MKHLITGGCGFLGTHITNELLSRGEEIISLDVWEAPDRSNDIDFRLGSVTDRDLIKSLMKGVDVVHHAAALVPLTKAGKQFHEVNAEGTRIVAEEAARAGVKYFVHTSSSAIFGKSECPVTSNTEPKPVDTYGESKYQAEKILKEIADANNMPVIVVRPRTIIAANRMGIFQILFDWIKDGRNVYTIGDGTNKLQFLHASDLISCYMFLCEKEKPGFYNVGTDRYGTLEETLYSVIRHAGTKSRVKHLPRSLTSASLMMLDKLKLSPLAPYHYLVYGEDMYFDLSPLTELGWKPKYSNEEMLCEAYDIFLRNYDENRNIAGASAHRKPVKEKVLWILKQLS